MLNRDQILEKSRGNIHCSQIVLGELAEELGYDKEELYRMACPFGGGMGLGDTCGCVTGALMAIGMAFGNSEPGNVEQDQLCREKASRFQEEFTRLRQSTICRELLGYDFRDPEQRKEAKENGATAQLCPDLMMDAIRIAAEIIREG
ncbi:MAG: C_GCAxxG_C_C family protein [Firmicutes bacterium]|nr:C_GCAxxG_C_C family protein [Bacillota bacterium]